ncbi:MAG: ShlB/FhaC/HecB family hemolysin secretion/activation protein [Candidatus Omnitrophica bacterium]|nr:ShlB/FhaC/HecB family hemolysin secretion/activation protein [Candidatus Omnitrophota bacterium]
MLESCQENYLTLKLKKVAKVSPSVTRDKSLFNLNKLQKSFLFLFACIFILLPSFSFAQDPPPGQGPGAEAERYQEQLESKEKALQKKPVGKPKIEIKKEELSRVPQLKFILKEVKITGATVFTQQDFYPVNQPYLNTEINQDGIEQLIGKIKDMYKKKGYPAVVVYLPEQDIQEGILEIKVVEGKMGSLKIEGNKYIPVSLLEEYFHTKKAEPLNYATITRDILRLNQNSDLKVETVISPGEKPGTSEVTLKVTEKFPWHAGFSEDSLGTRLTGKYRSGAYIRSTNASGRLDSFFANVNYSGRAQGEYISYSIPIGTYGTRLNVSAADFSSDLGKEFKANEIEGVTQIYKPYLSWELSLKETFQAYLNAGLEIKCAKKKISGTRTANDQLRIPYFSFDIIRLDNYGSTQFSPVFSFSTEHFLGASDKNHPTSSRAGSGGFYFKYEQALNRLQRMPFDSYATLRANYMAASHTLPSSEQIQIGGFNSVRGYAEGDYLADLGGYAQFDWYFPMYLIPKDWKLEGMDLPLYKRIEPILFVDLGGGKLKKILSGERQDKFLA